MQIPSAPCVTRDKLALDQSAQAVDSSDPPGCRGYISVLPHPGPSRETTPGLNEGHLGPQGLFRKVAEGLHSSVSLLCTCPCNIPVMSLFVFLWIEAKERHPHTMGGLGQHACPVWECVKREPWFLGHTRWSSQVGTFWGIPWPAVPHTRLCGEGPQRLWVGEASLVCLYPPASRGDQGLRFDGPWTDFLVTPLWVVVTWLAVCAAYLFI